MEKEIAEKCKRIFNSCILGIHYEVAKKYLDLALKRIPEGSEEYSEIEKEWSLLLDRMSI